MSARGKPRPRRLATRWGLAALALAAGAIAGAAAARAETADSDARAVAVADQVMKTLGGSERWNALPGLRWTFGSAMNDTVRNSRRHAWNKHNGWHRVEGKTRAGDSYVFIHNLNNGEGRAWMNGKPIEGDSLKTLLKRAMSLWINDTYWMLMPYKLRDPGVRLAMAGDSTANGATWDRVALSFDKVGETPGDHYWVYVNRATGRVERWDMVLQDDAPPPRTYSWEGWQEHDGLWFPTAHRQGGLDVFTRDVETIRTFAPEEFSKP